MYGFFPGYRTLLKVFIFYDCQIIVFRLYLNLKKIKIMFLFKNTHIFTYKIKTHILCL